MMHGMSLKYSENFINMKIDMKKGIALAIILIFIISIGFSCNNGDFDDEKELPLEGSYKIMVIDGCEYIQYQTTLYCGHQYTHHKYLGNFLTHKGNCKNHKSN